MLCFIQAMERQTCSWMCIRARILRILSPLCNVGTVPAAPAGCEKGETAATAAGRRKLLKVTPITLKPDLSCPAGESHREQVQRISNPS